MPYNSQKKYVEKNANLLLTVIRENPKKTLLEIETPLRKYKSFETMSLRMIRLYLNALEATGHIKKIGVHTKSYKIIKTEEFTYPKGVNNFVRLSKTKQVEAVS